MSEKLILCAGPYRYEGFYTLDADPRYEPDFCAVLPPLPREIRDGRWDEIYIVHGIEHFHKWEAEELIRQIHEALAPNGLLVMEQPNLEVCAKVMLGLMEPMTDPPENSGMLGIYGETASMNPLMTHKWGWTPTTLEALTRACGFTEVKTTEALSRPFAKGRDFRIEARKSA